MADYIRVERRSGIGILWIVRIRHSQRVRVARVLGSRMRVRLGPRLGHRRPMDHRAIHESNCSEDGYALEEKTTLVGFIRRKREQRPKGQG